MDNQHKTHTFKRKDLITSSKLGIQFQQKWFSSCPSAGEIWDANFEATFGPSKTSCNCESAYACTCTKETR